MRQIATLLALAVLCACTPAPKGDAAAAGSPMTRFGQDWSVTFDLNSWGRPMAHWVVKGDGTGEVWRAPGMSSNFASYDMEKYHLRMDATAMAKFVEVTDPLKVATRAPVKCETTVTDMPYGTLTWLGGKDAQTYTFNFGCTSPRANAIYDRIARAQEIVQKLSQIEAQPYVVEHIGSR